MTDRRTPCRSALDVMPRAPMEPKQMTEITAAMELLVEAMKFPPFVHGCKIDVTIVLRGDIDGKLIPQCINTSQGYFS